MTGSRAFSNGLMQDEEAVFVNLVDPIANPRLAIIESAPEQCDPEGSEPPGVSNLKADVALAGIERWPRSALEPAAISAVPSFTVLPAEKRGSGRPCGSD